MRSRTFQGEGLLIFARRGFISKKARERRIIYFILAATFLVWILVALENAIIPTLMAISQAEVTRVANEAIVNAIRGQIDDLLRDKQFLSFQTDSSGKVVYVQSNAGDLNLVQAEVLSILQETMKDLAGFNVYVPLGQTLGSRIFAPLGPKIKVTLYPYGTVKVDVKDSIEVKGINQLAYNVFLLVTCNVRIVIPLIPSETQVTSEIPLVTIILPGEVPNTYISVPGLSGTSIPLLPGGSPTTPVTPH